MEGRAPCTLLEAYIGCVSPSSGECDAIIAVVALLGHRGSGGHRERCRSLVYPVLLKDGMFVYVREALPCREGIWWNEVLFRFQKGGTLIDWVMRWVIDGEWRIFPEAG